MARTSLTDQLVDLRGRYTGETPSQCAPAVRAVTAALSVAQRSLLVDVLRGRPRAVPADLCRLLLPDAATHAQRELEAGLLLAVSQAAGPLALRPPVDVSRPAHALWSVEPEQAPRHTITLHVHDHALGPLLLGLLPRLARDRVEGLPGLRYRHHARCAELWLVGTDARAVLAGVSRRSWDAAVTLAEDLLAQRGVRPRWLWQRRPDRLSAEECAQIDEHGRVPGPVRLGSAMLRRGALFRSAAWVTAWASDDTWLVEWPGGPSLPEAVTALLHPIVGLPGAFRHGTIDGDSLQLVDQLSMAKLLLRSMPPPAGADGVPSRGTSWPDDFFRPWRVWAETTGRAAGDA
jgi:hypothetical protein